MFALCQPNVVTRTESSLASDSGAGDRGDPSTREQRHCTKRPRRRDCPVPPLFTPAQTAPKAKQWRS